MIPDDGRVRVKDRSVVLALVLTLILGPFGLFYVNFWLPLILLVALNVLAVATSGNGATTVAAIAIWPLSVVLGYLVARKRHQAFLAGVTRPLQVAPPPPPLSERARHLARILLGAAIACATLAVGAVLLSGWRRPGIDVALAMAVCVSACLMARRAVLGKITSKLEWICQVTGVAWTIAFVIFVMTQRWV
jgi:hypothetical protein